ncbi:ABC transporter substrate-binding protein [Roseovarius salis]|uniref:ABC transporter substrate-binding protein n=1 Tax=Roseovarius salis TaxID=3376063 RepID=UPI0037C605A4
MSPRRTAAPRLHPAAPALGEELRRGAIGRREFLVRATSLGLAPAAAYALGGLLQPRTARADPARGGTLRIQQNVKAPKDPRTYDWSELGNQTRGFLEYLVEYRGEGVFRGMLLEGWQVNTDATGYVLRLRRGVEWSNGDPFTAADVARNLERWCDTRVDGNSMASRFSGLIDPATGQLRAGAVTIEDDHTVRLSLSAPDISVIANMSDYPAAITHQSYDGGDPFAHGIGTGPFRPVELVPGERCVLERDTRRPWWGSDIFGGPYVDRVEFLDYGTDPANWVAAARAGEVDLLYESVGDFIEVLDSIGWVRSRAETAATTVIRGNQTSRVDGARPYGDRRVRRALALAVDNAICLELGYAGRGSVAANHHVSPVHPAYADIGPARYDPAAALSRMRDAGMDGFEHELITIDDEWQRNTGDAVAALMADAGLKVRRRILPGSTFWDNWKSFPFSSTEWNHRPLDVQALALAYRSDAVWNETGFANAEFDALLGQAMSLSDADTRRGVMARIETLLREEGVIIQPYWRALYTHHVPGLLNAGKHPSHEIHLYAIGFAA